MSVTRLLVGLAIGAGTVAVAMYARKASSQELPASVPPGALENAPGENIVIAPQQATGTAGSTLQSAQTSAADTVRSTSTAVQQKANDLLAQVKRYIDSARAQLDEAIAEGKATATQTRQELETRFETAKKDPQSARTAFR